MAKKKKGTYQTGSSSKLYDKKVRAKKPGKRVSAKGNVYYERRKNRSDMPGTLLGVPVKLKKYPKRPKASATTLQLENYRDRIKLIDQENKKRKDLATAITKVMTGKK